MRLASFVTLREYLKDRRCLHRRKVRANRPTVIRKNGQMSRAEITVIDGDGAGDTEALGRLLAQVSGRAAPLTPERLRHVLRTPSTSILVARLDGEIVGMALLLTLTTLSRDTGYVEEVVVDHSVRGQHISTALMNGLLELAARKGLHFVDLTSRPSREVANGLYRSLGFKLRETNCYRYDLEMTSAMTEGEG